jgi:transcriptional regulator with XRE-family HTH domain
MTATELRLARQRLGLTQAELGAAAEPPVIGPAMSRLESGARPISPGMAARLREALGRLGRAPA